MESINTSDESYEQDVLKAELPVVVDVWAPWCGPCKMVGPALERIADVNEHKFKLVFANMEHFPMTAEELGVKATPTLLIFKEGREVARRSGAVMQSQIQLWLDENL